MDALIEAQALSCHFPRPRSVRMRFSGEHPVLRAVDQADFSIAPGQSVGLVGESGSGKTTLGRLLLRLQPPTSGNIRFRGQSLAAMDRACVRAFRTQAQLVFQNPFEALNPRFTIRRSLAEPLVNTGVPRSEHTARIAAALRLVHLPEAGRYLDSFPHQVSGGQLQRIVLARALVLEPKFLVADEPVSMLDVSVRASVLNLLREVRERMGLTALYISHDLSLVNYVCDRTMVMYLGRIVEDAPTAKVIAAPAHPYTAALVAAAPRPSVDQPRGPLPITGSLGPRPAAGCGLRPRCPHALARCEIEDPPLREISPGQRVACHLHAA